MNPAVPEKRVGTEVEGVKPLADECSKSRIDLAAAARVEDVDFKSDRTGRRLCIALLALGRRISRVNKQPHTAGRGHKLTQDTQPLCRQFRREKIDTGQVTAWPGEARDETKLDRVFGSGEYDRDGLACGLRRQCRRQGECGDHGNLPAY